jgi:hypothetical protein
MQLNFTTVVREDTSSVCAAGFTGGGENHLTRRPFGGMLLRIAVLLSPVGSAECKAEIAAV